MRRHSRTRRFLKWIGVVVCVGLVLIYLASGWRTLRIEVTLGNSHFLVDIEQGQLDATRLPIHRGDPDDGAVFGTSIPAIWEALYGSSSGPWRFGFLNGYGQRVVPLWLLIFPATVLTGLLFWSDRSGFGCGCCSDCGYDLRGAHVVCPECGAPAP